MITPKSHLELFLASAHFFPTHGGAQLRYLRYIPGLRKRGIYTRVLTGTPKLKKNMQHHEVITDDLNKNNTVLLQEFIDRIPIQRVPLPDHAGWRRSIAFNQAILRFCRQPSYRPDVVQLVSSLQPRSFFWMRQLKNLGAALVYAYTLPMKLPANPIKRAIRCSTLRALYRSMDCIIVNNPQMRQQMLDLGVSVRMEYIPNGVDLKRFRPPSTAEEKLQTRRVLGLPEHQTVISTVGAVHPRKGTDLLLETWNRLTHRLPNAHLYVVGLRKDLTYPDLKEFGYKLQSLITASGAPERIHFTGLIRNVEEYLRASDVFIFSSQREGMPNVVLEAMATGLPVVLTPFVGLSTDLGRSSREYLLAERDPDILAAVLCELLGNISMSEKMGKNARQWVEDTLDLDRCLERYALLYYELAQKTGHASRLV
jgi:glycosyltransferase involved in cell wall biosynthesis